MKEDASWEARFMRSFVCSTGAWAAQLAQAWRNTSAPSRFRLSQYAGHISARIENPEDRDCVGAHIESNGHAVLESNDSQAWPDVIARGSSFGKGPQTLAALFNPFDVMDGTRIPAMISNVVVKVQKIGLGFFAEKNAIDHADFFA